MPEMGNGASSMNILHITTFLQGGAGQAIVELACAQALSGHKVTVVTSGTGEQDYGNYPQWIDRLASGGVHLVSVESTFKRDLALNIAAFRQICAAVDCHALSVIHTHAAIPSMLALLLRSRADHAIPVLQTMHGWGIRKDASQAATDVTLMNELDRVVTPSEASRRLLERLGIARRLITVVPYGIAASPDTEDDPGIGLLRQWRSRGLLVLVCVGTVGPRKNQRLLMQAMVHPQVAPTLACAVVGEGEEVRALEALVKEAGIEERVCFFGYQPTGARFINAADWLVLPSNDEGLPLSILEAYRAGVPVIGSDIPEIAEVIIPEQTGILFQAGNVDSLAQSLQAAAALPAGARLKMGDRAKSLWHEQYRLDRMLDRYAQIYQDLLAPGWF